MDPEALSDAIRATPFRPFQLILGDGSRVRVRHREWIAFSGERVAVVIDPDERTHNVDLMLVTKIEIDPLVPAVRPRPGRTASRDVKSLLVPGVVGPAPSLLIELLDELSALVEEEGRGDARDGPSHVGQVGDASRLAGPAE